jgi:uncharacterized protein (TIGR02284 family)
MTMAAGTTEVINDLIQTCIDGQKGFEAAAGAVDDPTIKDELVGYSWQRQQFATELKSRLEAFGQEPSDSGSMSGAAHRGWMELKSAVGASDGRSILAECERGEDVALEAYQKAMSEGVPQEYKKVVESQFLTIKRTHDRIRALRDAVVEDSAVQAVR